MLGCWLAAQLFGCATSVEQKVDDLKKRGIEVKHNRVMRVFRF